MKSFALSAKLFFCIVVVFLLPPPALAHLVTTGMGPVYDGIGHLLLTPEDIIPVIAVTLYAGLLGTTTSRYNLFVLPLSWLVGGIGGLILEAQSISVLPALSFFILGGLVALELRIPPFILCLLTGVVGIVHGFYNGIALSGGPELHGLLGISTTIFVLTSLISALVITLTKPYMKIAIRVLGSWTAATGLLMIGWQMHKHLPLN